MSTQLAQLQYATHPEHRTACWHRSYQKSGNRQHTTSSNTTYAQTAARCARLSSHRSNAAHTAEAVVLQHESCHISSASAGRATTQPRRCARAHRSASMGTRESVARQPTSTSFRRARVSATLMRRQSSSSFPALPSGLLRTCAPAPGRLGFQGQGVAMQEL